MTTGLLQLYAHGYDLVIDAAHGASLASLRWLKPNGEWIDLIHPCPPAAIARNGGSFVMAPFANRLDAGRFETEAGPIEVPLNRPEQKMAIHGFSRDRMWAIVEASVDTVTLADDFAEPTNGFAYRLTQSIAPSREGVRLSLRLTNTAPQTLPYGFGFHPWFRKDDATWLTLAADRVLGRNERGFPTEPIAGPDFAHGVHASSVPWFDGHVVGWAPREAMIDWRREGVTLKITARGALTNLHVYVPDDQRVLCVEPVSHVPDVHNRRQLAGYGDLTWLRPGETMTGSMTLSPHSVR